MEPPASAQQPPPPPPPPPQQQQPPGTPRIMPRLELSGSTPGADEATPRKPPPPPGAAGREERGGKADREERAVSSTPRDAELPELEEMATAQCPHCSRSFAAARLEKHMLICQQAQARKAAAQSKAEARERAAPAEKKKAEAEPRAPGRWKGESANLRAAMEYNRKLKAAEKAGIDISTLPPPPSAESDARVECPHCHRKFNADVADRHIPKCNARKR